MVRVTGSLWRSLYGPRCTAAVLWTARRWLVSKQFSGTGEVQRCATHVTSLTLYAQTHAVFHVTDARCKGQILFLMLPVTHLTEPGSRAQVKSSHLVHLPTWSHHTWFTYQGNSQSHLVHLAR